MNAGRKAGIAASLAIVLVALSFGAGYMVASNATYQVEASPGVVYEDKVIWCWEDKYLTAGSEEESVSCYVIQHGEDGSKSWNTEATATCHFIPRFTYGIPERCWP